MKNILYSILILAFAFSSCKKEQPAKKQESVQLVQFKVGFSQTAVPFGAIGKKINALQTTAADTSLTNNLERIDYLIYDASGTFVSEYRADSGELKVNLATGSYTVVVIGLEKSFYVKSNQEKLSTLNIGIIEGAVYFKKQNFVVNNTALTNTVLLNRISSRIVVVAKDSLPVYKNFVFLQILDVKKNVFYANSETMGVGTLFNEPMYVPVSGSSETRASFDYFYKSALSLKIGLAQKDPRQSIPDQMNFKILNNIPGKINAITTLTGSFNSTNGSTAIGDSFDAKVDTLWKAPINKGF